LVAQYERFKTGDHTDTQPQARKQTGSSVITLVAFM
jgi:hypothetical protein